MATTTTLGRPGHCQPGRGASQGQEVPCTLVMFTCSGSTTGKGVVVWLPSCSTQGVPGTPPPLLGYTDRPDHHSLGDRRHHLSPLVVGNIKYQAYVQA